MDEDICFSPSGEKRPTDKEDGDVSVGSDHAPPENSGDALFPDVDTPDMSVWEYDRGDSDAAPIGAFPADSFLSPPIREAACSFLDEDSLSDSTGDTPEAAFLPDAAITGDFSPRLLGVRLRKAGQVYFIADTKHTVRIGSKIVVAFEQGTALGEVVSIVRGDCRPTDGEGGIQVPGEVTGLATARDIAQNAENSILAAEASAFCKSCIRQRNLDMKLVDVEVLHDRSKILFFFTAPSRIDFRELVKDLVRNYRTRIELRQIGVRHETQMVGGLGNCGMVCCCHQFLHKFAPVTIKMAKEQNLFLNPAKLSGMCGRLLCCLSFEQNTYEEFNRRCPKIGKRYMTGKGLMKILRANLFNRSIVTLAETGEEMEMSLEEWDNLAPKRAESPAPDQQRALAPRGDGGRKNASGQENAPEHGEDYVAEGEQNGKQAPPNESKPRHNRLRKRRKEQQ